MAGSCLTAYLPLEVWGQFPGELSSYERQDLPAAFTWLKMLGTASGCSAGEPSSVTPCVSPDEAAM